MKFLCVLYGQFKICGLQYFEIFLEGVPQTRVALIDISSLLQRSNLQINKHDD
jgi:hypothetical protein